MYARTVDLKNNMSALFKTIVETKEKLTITRPQNKNVVILSEERVAELEEKERELAYLLKLQKINEDIENGVNLIDGRKFLDLD